MNKSGKGSAVVIIILVILLLASLGASAFFGYKLYIEKPDVQTEVETPVEEENQNESNSVSHGMGALIQKQETLAEGVVRAPFNAKKVLNQDTNEVSYYSVVLPGKVNGINGVFSFTGKKATYVNAAGETSEFNIPVNIIDALRTTTGIGGAEGIFVLGENGKVYGRIQSTSEKDSDNLVEIAGVEDVVVLYTNSSTNYLGGARPTAIGVDLYGNAYDLVTAFVNTPKSAEEVENNTQAQPQ